jgi:G3E family GTPase
VIKLNNDTKPTRIILITGFLGSGKTSLMRHLLTTYASNENRVGVIVNEFGKVSIDGAILQNYSSTITELNNGSIFCQCLAGTFVDSIIDMLGLGLTDIFIESTGLADPSNMNSILQNVKKKTDFPYTYAGVLCLADAKYFRRLSQSNTMINRQLLQSTVVVLNKKDLVDQTELDDATRAIKKLNPLARVIPAVHGQIDPGSLERLRPSRLGRNLPSLNTPSSRSKTMIIELCEAISREALQVWLEGLRNHVYRLKGFVNLAGEQGVWQIDMVGGDISIIPSASENKSEIVLIPYLEPDKIEQIREHAAGTLPVKFRWQNNS